MTEETHLGRGHWFVDHYAGHDLALYERRDQAEPIALLVSTNRLLLDQIAWEHNVVVVGGLYHARGAATGGLESIEEW